MGLLGLLLGLLKLFLGPSWAMLGFLVGARGPKLSIFLQFFNVFGWPMLGFLGSSFGVCGHSWGPLGAILSLLGRFLGPPRGHLWPCWALFGARLEPFWASYGPDRAPWGPLWAVLVPCCAMLCHLEVSWELFGRHWSLPGAILGQIGVPRVPCGLSRGHLEACWGVSDLLYFSNAW